MKKYLAMLLACAMIFAFAAGCAQQNPANSDEPTATNAPTGVEATPVQNTELVTDGNETVSDKDTINIAVDREPATLNPGGVSSNVNEIIMRNVLDTLLKFDENAIPQANLATEWEAIDDLTWQFAARRCEFHQWRALHRQGRCVFHQSPCGHHHQRQRPDLH